MESSTAAPVIGPGAGKRRLQHQRTDTLRRVAGIGQRVHMNQPKPLRVGHEESRIRPRQPGIGQFDGPPGPCDGNGRGAVQRRRDLAFSRLSGGEQLIEQAAFGLRLVLGRELQGRGLDRHRLDESLEAPLEFTNGGLDRLGDSLAGGSRIGPEPLVLDDPAAGGDRREGDQTDDAQSGECTGDEWRRPHPMRSLYPG